jgi:hypothetical protein
MTAHKRIGRMIRALPALNSEILPHPSHPSQRSPARPRHFTRFLLATFSFPAHYPVETT